MAKPDLRGNIVAPSAIAPDSRPYLLQMDADGYLYVRLAGVQPSVPVVGGNSSSPVIIDANEPSLLRPTPKMGRFSTSVLPAGNSYQTAFSVPANEIWRLRYIAAQYAGTITGVILSPFIKVSGVYMLFSRFSPIVSSSIYTTAADFLLYSSCDVGVYVASATLNDTLNIVYSAERVY